MKLIQSVKNLFHLFIAVLANIYYGFPSRKLKVIGVTGTDGKTTTTHLIYHILRSAGKKVSMISSVYANIGGKAYDTGFHVTTPDIFPLQNFLNKSVASGDEFFVLETTSHALYQNRVYGVQYEFGVLTNVTHEHLDFHKTLKEYIKTKSLLLKRAKTAVTNIDDSSYPVIKKLVAKYLYTYGFKNKADFSLDLNPDAPFFNKYNYLAAYSVCHIIGIANETIKKAISSFKLPPGRLNIVYDKDFKVIIDFAHTPNAINQVLQAIKRQYLTKGGRIIHVFGAAGARDKTKRPLMGEASSRFADLIFLTEEDYRTEDLLKICEGIAAGIKKTVKYKVIINREEAIKQAISLAKKDDVVVVTGKGHEKSLCRGKKEYPWDEFATVKKYVNS